jgi:hypothetical protein
LEVVTICNHLVAFLAIQLEDEIRRKAVPVSIDLLIEALRGNAIESSQICVD